MKLTIVVTASKDMPLNVIVSPALLPKGLPKQSDMAVGDIAHNDLEKLPSCQNSYFTSAFFAKRNAFHISARRRPENGGDRIIPHDKSENDVIDAKRK